MNAAVLHLDPCTAAEAEHYARTLRRLLDALDGEIVVAALVRDSKPDLLDPERREVNRVREFLDGRIAMGLECFDLRSRGLALLDAFANEIKPAAEIHSNYSYGPRAGTRHVGRAVLLRVVGWIVGRPSNKADCPGALSEGLQLDQRAAS